MIVKVEKSRYNKDKVHVQILKATAEQRKSFYDRLCCQSFPVFQAGDVFTVPAKDQAALNAFVSSL